VSDEQKNIIEMLWTIYLAMPAVNDQRKVRNNGTLKI